MAGESAKRENGNATMGHFYRSKRNAGEKERREGNGTFVRHEISLAFDSGQKPIVRWPVKNRCPPNRPKVDPIKR